MKRLKQMDFPTDYSASFMIEGALNVLANNGCRFVVETPTAMVHHKLNFIIENGENRLATNCKYFKGHPEIWQIYEAHATKGLYQKLTKTENVAYGISQYLKKNNNFAKLIPGTVIQIDFGKYDVRKVRRNLNSLLSRRFGKNATRTIFRDNKIYVTRFK